MADVRPIRGATYWPVSEREVPYYRDDLVYDWDWELCKEVGAVRQPLVIRRVGRRYSDGGYEVLCGNAWYDCYWSYRYACWCYGLDSECS